MPSIHSRLRRQFPFLTPPFVDEDYQVPSGDVNAPRINPRDATLASTPKIRVAFGANGLSGLKNDEPPAPVKFPVATPELTPPVEHNPYEGYTPAPTPVPPISVRVGANATGLDPIGRQVAVLDTERQAAQDYPSSKVTSSGEVLPPKMHHGFWDRLKSVGKGALIGFGSVDPRLGGAGGIGAGIAGALRGGFDPTSIDRMEAERKVQRDTQRLGQQLEIEDLKSRVEARRNAPQIAKDAAAEKAKEQERDNLRAAWAAIVSSGQDFSPDNEEHKQIHDRAQAIGMVLPYGKKSANEREPMRVTVENADGSKSVKMSYDSGRTWVEAADLKSAPPREKGGEDYATARDWNYKKQAEAESVVKGYEKQLEGMPMPAADDPQYYPIQAERERIQKLLDAAKSDAQKYRDEGDKAAVKVREVSATTPTPNYSGRTMTKANLARYAKDKGLTEEEARRQLEGMGITIR